MNAICKLLNIKYPIIQGGMVWTSGYRLASAVSNAGGLGVIGAGSMNPQLLEEHIIKAKASTNNSLAVNFPLLYGKIEEQFKVAIDQGIKIFITSAGSPNKYTKYLKEQGLIVMHVCSSPMLAKKCEDAGVDAVICEGFEAGGHNGRDEITTLTLIPQVRKLVSIPIVAAGGIACGKSILAVMNLGAQGAQLGTRFLMTQESSAHIDFKKLLLKATPSDTKLMMKSYVPVRLLKNKFFEEIEQLEEKCCTKEELIAHLGKGRARKGILEGDLIDGELEIGQICSNIHDIPTVTELMNTLIDEYNHAVSLQTSL